MIKLTLPAKPLELTEALQRKLTDIYMNDSSKHVWKRKIIKDAVIKIAYGKCCYSECPLGKGGSYMEIEHFYPKHKYPERVVEWGNLLPSSKTCNTTKGKHDTGLEPIINPCIDDPKEHLYIVNCRYYPKTEKGKLTIKKVGINNQSHFVNKRLEVEAALDTTLKSLHHSMIRHIEHIREWGDANNPLMKQLKALLKQGSREKDYAANVSTIILQSEHFDIIKHTLTAHGLWDEELANLEDELRFCALMK